MMKVALVVLLLLLLLVLMLLLVLVPLLLLVIGMQLQQAVVVSSKGVPGCTVLGSRCLGTEILLSGSKFTASCQGSALYLSKPKVVQHSGF
jgi:hypothetical protein